MTAPSTPRSLLVVSTLAVSLAAAVVATTVYGVITGWSPFPVGDTWGGVLGAWYRFRDGDTSALWEQAADHRIVLARLLFWLDLVALGGSSPVILVSSLALLTATSIGIVWLLLRNVREQGRSSLPGIALWALAAVPVLILWSWVGSPNLLWAFQVSFFLVQALTVGSLAFLAASTSGDATRRRWFTAASVACAAAAPWTIALGLATPFIAGGAAAILKRGRGLVLVFAIIGVGSTVLYLRGYRAAGYGLGTVPLDPVNLTGFALTYLGGPIAGATGSTTLGLIAGAALVALTASWFVARGRDRAFTAASTSLAGILVFTIIGGVLVTAGRGDRGPLGATADRYQTLLLVGWASLMALYAPTLARRLHYRPLIGGALLLALPALLLIKQPWALADNSQRRTQHEQAALALALGVPDVPDLLALYPRLVADHLTPVADPAYAGLRARLGAVAFAPLSAECTYLIDARDAIPSSPFARIAATAPDTDSLAEAGVLPIVDERSTIVGFAQAASGDPVTVVGYVSADPFDGSLAVVDGDRACPLVAGAGPHGD